MKIKYFIICIVAAISCLLCSCQKEENPVSEEYKTVGKFSFTILKVGKADAIVLSTENHNVIIDCGEKYDGEKINEYLEKNNISNVDYIFITHFDKDHVGGFAQVVKNIGADNVIVPNYEEKSSEYKKYLKAVEENELALTILTDDISFVLDDVLFEVSAAKKEFYEEGSNEFSLAISVTHGENTFLFAGDAEKERISEILKKFNHEYDFLKVPHHGRYNENTSKLVNTIKPKYSVICDSKKNPSEDETIHDLQSVGSEVYCTKDGSVTVVSDGREIKISQ